RIVPNAEEARIEGGKYRTRIPGQQKHQLEARAKKNKITLATLLYSAWAILLQKYTYSDDVVFGTTVSGRSAKLKGIENIVGLFINTLPLRVTYRPGENTTAFLARVNRELQEREHYETAPLVKIREYSAVGMDEEMFDSVVVIENYPLEVPVKRKKLPLTVETYAIEETLHYSLGVSVSLFDEDIDVTVHYDKTQFEKEKIEAIAGHFTNILTDLEAVSGGIGELEMLAPAEKEEIRRQFNRKAAPYTGAKTIHELFVEQVRRTPHRTAVVEVNYETHHTADKNEGQGVGNRT
ncbi:MAG: hypothetical protein GY757_13675, partial [bacterium]|nr:hypothetical protein [bacterium]